MKVWFPSRISERHVGGNTTYTRALMTGLAERGVATGLIPSARNPGVTALSETAFGLRRRTREDVLHYSADTGPVVRTRTPSVVTVHGVASRWITVARNQGQERVWRARVGRALRSCDAIITVSESSKADIAQVFDVEAPITVIPHGIDVASLQDVVDGPPARLASLEGVPFLLYVGNIEPRKNLIELVRALEDPRLQGLRLVVGGKPAWNAEDSLAALRGSARVDYLGFLDEVEKRWLMQRCLLFVFPSLYEGFGFPVLEAMAAGASVACTDVGSLKEVAGPAHRLPGTGADEIAEGLTQALSEVDGPAGAERRRAGAAWVQNFAWSRSVDLHLRVYRRVLER